ncbi:MAG: ATP-binding protein [Planctomycetota bacterium]
MTTSSNHGNTPLAPSPSPCGTGSAVLAQPGTIGASPGGPARTFAFHLGAALLVLAGVAMLVVGVRRYQDTQRDAFRQQTAAAEVLIDTGKALAADIERAVAPAMARTRMLASSPEIRAAIRSGDRDALTSACNRAITASTEIDAVALFDAQGAIIAINSVYADASPIPADRVDRILSMSFAKRDIIMRCTNNSTHEEVLEFQTGCDITPAFFESSGLSVAHSVPVYDEADGRQLGVVSTRLRFERVSSLTRDRSIAGGQGSLTFVTDAGKFFDEAINSGAAAPPIPAVELGGIVAPLATGRSLQSIVERGECFLGLFRMNAFETLQGGGIQVLVGVDRDWVNREANLARLLGAGTPVLLGVLLLLTGALVFTLGTVARQRSILRVAHAAANEANRAKSDFLANMSHEIRTPLTAILGFADILREDGNLTNAPDHRVQTLDTISSAGRHLLTVINDILDLSKIEADKMTVEKISTPLVRVLVEVESLMRPRAAGKGVALNMRLGSPVPDRVLGDPTRLRQVLMNLAGNAVKFTDSGSVTMTTGVQNVDGRAHLVIDIEDTGAGMTGEQVRHLFSAFGQADGTVTRRHGGTGLGLTISRRLANLMGGNVTLLRSAPGKGSCFRLLLPLDPIEGSTLVTDISAVQTAASTTSVVKPISLHGRILLAEDGPDNQRLITFHLRKAGAFAEVAENGRIALEMLERARSEGKPYDLLLTDMQMPEMDGYTLARTLRERGSTIPIVALTAHAMAEDRAKCLAAGCDDYASKPIDKFRLLATCETWIGRVGGEIGVHAAA